MPVKRKFIFESTEESVLTLTRDRVNLDFNINYVNGRYKTFYGKFNPYHGFMDTEAGKAVMYTCYILLFQQ